MNEIIFFDIDYTLIRPESKLAIIDKENPGEVLLRIDSSDIPLLTSVWKKFDIMIEYNGKNFWLSPDLFKSIKRKVKGITSERIGISYREWSNKEISEQQSKGLEFLLHNLQKLKDSGVPVALLTARGSKESHEYFIKKIKDEITSKLRLSVIKEYFINDIDSQTSSDLTASRKSKIILEHLIGYKIKSNRFTDLKQSEYSKVKFYDDDIKNIEAVKNLQRLFETCLNNTEKSLKSQIMQRFKYTKLEWETNLVTNNDLNPFVNSTNSLISPYDSTVDLFEAFRKRRF